MTKASKASKASDVYIVIGDNDYVSDIEGVFTHKENAERKIKFMTTMDKYKKDVNHFTKIDGPDYSIAHFLIEDDDWNCEEKMNARMHEDKQKIKDECDERIKREKKFDEERKENEKTLNEFMSTYDAPEKLCVEDVEYFYTHIWKARAFSSTTAILYEYVKNVIKRRFIGSLASDLTLLYPDTMAWLFYM
jgi:hypothetical protein